MVGMAGLCRNRDRSHRRLSAGMAGFRRAIADVFPSCPRLRHSASRRAHAALARQGVPRIPAPRERILARPAERRWHRVILVRNIWRRVAAYAAHDDPMVETCNLIAL